MASFLCANTACLFQLIVESSPSHNTAAKSILTRLRHPHASNLKPTIPAKDLATVIVSRSQITYTKTDLLRFHEAGWNFRGLRPWSHQNAGCCLVHSSLPTNRECHLFACARCHMYAVYVVSVLISDSPLGRRLDHRGRYKRLHGTILLPQPMRGHYVPGPRLPTWYQHRCQ